MTKVVRRSLRRVAAVAVVLASAAWTVATARAGNDSSLIDDLTFEIRTGMGWTDTEPETEAPSDQLCPGTIFICSDDKLPIVAPNRERFAAQPAAAALEGLGRIHIEYVPPKKPANQKTYEAVRSRRVLERLEEIFRPFRLPEDLYIKTLDCDGKPNTYFDREEDRPTVKICYEYMKALHDRMPKKPTTAGLAPTEVLIGQYVFAAAHELGHALFDIYNIPIFGRQEDAADQFATYFILQFGGERAHRLILGAAYAYRGFVKQLHGNPKVTLPLAAFSSDHGQPEQRFYNLVCIAYGYDPKVFAAAVDKKWLPSPRAKVCKLEYQNLRYAVKATINPHIDKALADKVIETGLPPAPNPPEPAKSSPPPAESAPPPGKSAPEAAKSTPQAAKDGPPMSICRNRNVAVCGRGKRVHARRMRSSIGASELGPPEWWRHAPA